ncbi:MAG: TIGR01212 family radical SAM protein [Bacteroidales bacterium]|nr:TIGR01212 family radical SAM protein [Bacteroidales bacterium]
MQQQRYRTYSQFLNEHFSFRVQKLPVDAGFTCPNRDGTKGVGGCIYCNNQSFNTSYCHPSLSVREQLERGKQFFAGKYPGMKYLAYFQAHTGTHASLDRLKSLYEEAAAVSDVVGIVIATRPDCVQEELLQYLHALQRRCFVMIEYGVETLCDSTLSAINRCHDAAASVAAIRLTAQYGIPQCAHLILGLPGESRGDMLSTVDAISALPVDVVKFHQLQVIRGTMLERKISAGEMPGFRCFTLEEYLDLCAEVIERISPSIAIERFVSESPSALLVMPKWGVKPDKFKAMLHEILAQRKIFQGKMQKNGKT